MRKVKVEDGLHWLEPDGPWVWLCWWVSAGAMGMKVVHRTKLGVKRRA